MRVPDKPRLVFAINSERVSDERASGRTERVEDSE